MAVMKHQPERQPRRAPILKLFMDDSPGQTAKMSRPEVAWTSYRHYRQETPQAWRAKARGKYRHFPRRRARIRRPSAPSSE